MKKYKRPLSENKEFLQELKDLDNFMDKEQTVPEKIQELKIPKKDSDNFMDKEQTVPEKIITKQLKIPQTNMLEIFVVCFGSLYNRLI